MRVVIALGGNAILRKGESGRPEEQWRNIRRTASLIASTFPNDEVIITHGNGPQVGYLLEIMNLAKGYPAQSMDLANAMTQGWLGFMLQAAVEDAFKGTRRAVTLITRTLVSPQDPSFKNPTKYVGGYFSKEEASKLSAEFGWVFKEDPRGGYRRVVPSPEPMDILESDIIDGLVKSGVIVISTGGGGIPVIKTSEGLRPVEAVVDKDLASSLLAVKLKADLFIILTDVKGVAINFGKPGELWLREVRADELESYYRRGEFPPGSMGPKVLAAIKYVSATRRTAIIGSLDELPEMLRGASGTAVKP
ncbi:carbamate kinase [Acidilobus sp. 7A]|uniref:carbamate kinase n=1 Tax=Acidilobus sp. 7A TaxID=1577685 RepID=UPI000E3B7104